MYPLLTTGKFEDAVPLLLVVYLGLVVPVGVSLTLTQVKTKMGSDESASFSTPVQCPLRSKCGGDIASNGEVYLIHRSWGNERGFPASRIRRCKASGLGSSRLLLIIVIAALISFALLHPSIRSRCQ